MSTPSSYDRPHALANLRDELRTFATERDWDQFHSPKNLAMALNVEAAELLENFQWLTEEQSCSLPPETLSAARNEMADVFLYLIQLADKLDINLIDAAERKLSENAQKYPIDKSRGSSKKYTQF